MEQRVVEAWELEGVVDEEGRLSFEGPLPVRGPRRVRVILLPEAAISPSPSDEAEASEAAWLRAASNNPTFAFLEDPEEDIYGLEDGEPFVDEPVEG